MEKTMRPSRLAYTCYGWWGSPVRGGVRVAARAAQVKVKARATNKSSNNKCHPALLLFLFFSLLNASFFCLFLFVVFNAYFMVFLVLFLVASKSLSKYLNLFSLSLTFFLSEKNSRFFAYVQCSYSSKSAFFFSVSVHSNVPRRAFSRYTNTRFLFGFVLALITRIPRLLVSFVFFLILLLLRVSVAEQSQTHNLHFHKNPMHSGLLLGNQSSTDKTAACLVTALLLLVLVVLL